MKKLLQVIQTHGKALEIYTRTEFPVEWAEINFKIAKCYFALAKFEKDSEDKIKYLETAVNCIRFSIQIYTSIKRLSAPLRNLLKIGDFCLEYLQFDSFDEDEEIIKRYFKLANDCFEQSLCYHDEDNFPDKRAEICEKKAKLYEEVPIREDETKKWRENQTLFFFRESLKGYTKLKHPEKYAEIQNQIGHILFEKDDLIGACKAYSLAIWAYRSMDDESAGNKADGLDEIRKNLINVMYSEDYEFIKKTTSEPPSPSSSEL